MVVNNTETIGTRLKLSSMCNYKYKNKRHILFDTQCIYPNFYQKYAAYFKQTTQLPIDTEGYCIFHSKNIDWKNQLGFTEKFGELFDVTLEVCKREEIPKWAFNFSGFYFYSERVPLIITNYTEQVFIDFTFCEFLKGLTLTNSSLKSIDVRNSYFYGTLIIRDTNFVANIDCTNSIFDNGVSISGCQFNGYNYFDDCHFNNPQNTVDCAFSFRDCASVDYINFENSNFETRVFFENVIFKNEVVFDSCTFSSEFLFHDNEINGEATFKEAVFLLSANLNPLYSTANFRNIIINETGRLIFRGKQPMEDMVKGQIQLSFKSNPEGLISFENFNLNKLYPPSKLKIFDLEKLGKVEIGKGCRKYYCQTDIFEISTTNANQKLILDIVNVFCNYFQIQNNYNLGVEVVERNLNVIKYFFFTDEVILKEEFENRIKQNEFDLWRTFSNLSKSAVDVISLKDIEIKNCLIDIAGLFLKIGNQIQYNNLFEEDLTKIITSISIDKSSKVDIPDLFKEILSRYLNFTKNPPTINITNMGDNIFNNNAYAQQFGIITNNAEISNEQKTMIFEAIEDIKSEKAPEKKESKLSKFIKEFGPTIGETAVKAILAAIS